MAAVKFAKAFHRHTTCPDAVMPGATVREVLDGYFTEHPTARGYALDEHGAVRKHVTVFVDGEQVADRIGLADPVNDGSTVHLVQALSGG